MKPRCPWSACLALHNVDMHGRHFQTGINCYEKHFVQFGVTVKWTAYKDRVMTRERETRFAAFYTWIFIAVQLKNLDSCLINLF